MEPAQMSGASIVDQSVTIDSQLLPPSSDHDADAKRRSLYDDLEPDVKRQKFSSPPTKLCITCSLSVGNDRAFHIFIAELNSSCYDASKTKDDFISIAPTFRLELEGGSKRFGLLGSTLYIVESTDLDDDPDRKFVYTIDLSKCDLTKPSLKKLEKSELDSVPDMMHRKRSPYATPTPDGKLMVFSSIIRLEFPCKTAGDNDFELYDPVAKTWQKLPGIGYNWLSYTRRHSSSYSVLVFSFTFIDNSTFLFQTSTGLMFSLNLGSIDEGWKQWRTFFNVDTVPFDNGRFFVIDGLLCVTPFGAYDTKKEIFEWFSIPRSPDNVVHPCAITVLDDVKNGKFNFCCLQCGISEETGYPHLVINTFSCDVTKYKEDKEKMGDSAQLSSSMSVGESFKFKFRVDGMQCSTFIPFNLFCF